MSKNFSRHFHFFADKGGVGCTTTAAAFLVLLRRHDVRSTIVDWGDVDIHAVLGTTANHPHPEYVIDASFAEGDPDFDPIESVYLSGFAVVIHVGPVTDDRGMTRVRVVENSYLSLRRMVISTRRHDATVLVATAGAALRLGDVERVVGASVIEIPRDPAVARGVDAGLLLARLPRTLEPLMRLLTLPPETQ